MLAEDKARAAHFHRAPGANEGDAYADLFRVLAKPHWFAQEKALFALARLVEGRLVKDLGLSAVAAACGGDTVAVTTAAPMGVAAQTIVQLVQWCCAQLEPQPPAARRALGGVGARRVARRPRRAPAGHALRRRRAPRAAALRQLRAQLDAPDGELGAGGARELSLARTAARRAAAVRDEPVFVVPDVPPARARGDAARRVRGGAHGRRETRDQGESGARRRPGAPEHRRGRAAARKTFRHQKRRRGAASRPARAAPRARV